MKRKLLLVLGFITVALVGLYAWLPPSVNTDNWPPKARKYYEEHKGDSLPSVSKGSTGNGTLKHGKLIPFKGPNYFYFSQKSYLLGRAFTTDKVQAATLNAYKKLEKLYPERKFGIMECSNQEGGKLWPHHTHQNGLSIDFMTPVLKDGKPYTGLDNKGINHYWLAFDEHGRLKSDTTVVIDFNLVAHHILLLNEQAKKQGLKITKVIFMLELKDELFATHYGKKLKKSDVYFAQRLSDFINKEHDDHYHVDFGAN